MERQEFIAGGKNYEYYLVNKSIKTIRLVIDSEMRIVVTSPYYISRRKIQEFILHNKGFIEKNISKREEIRLFHNIKEFKTGEYFLLFGEKIGIVAKKYFEDRVFLEEKTLYILLRESTLSERKKRFENFLKKTGKKVFKEILDENYPFFQDKIKQKPKITVRKMKTKWGSANPSKNKITLNTALLYAPKELIEYVLIHELCHFYHLNHSKDFYNLLIKVMPDYKQKRKRLREKYGFLI